MEINKNNMIEQGYILCPYIITNPTKTDINGYVVWYDNKFKNLWLKIKRFFYTPKGLKNFKRYTI